ncbi:hypothetical protein M404DRAFT_997705 [Pisolithus tinctorius Marx 270]|uniref:Uncharacterized protein n=1 Tax=Pisolithus tinctorius Marx 270 TaxID=870435 RepID=A0A0C3PHM9_PISTI|nr:hypothetical protein M404DRAFT_997705 [Pisolithus tinctorius Marx 270]
MTEMFNGSSAQRPACTVRTSSYRFQLSSSQVRRVNQSGARSASWGCSELVSNVVQPK